MAATAVPAALALLTGSTGAPNGSGNQTQGQTPLAKALLAALSVIPTTAQAPGTAMSFLNTQNPAPSSITTNTNNLCEVYIF